MSEHVQQIIASTTPMNTDQFKTYSFAPDVTAMHLGYYWRQELQDSQAHWYSDSHDHHVNMAFLGFTSKEFQEVEQQYGRI